MKNGEFAFSTDEEWFTGGPCATRAEAIEEGRCQAEEEEECVFYTGEIREVRAGDLAGGRVERLLEAMAENNLDRVGERGFEQLDRLWRNIRYPPRGSSLERFSQRTSERGGEKEKRIRGFEACVDLDERIKKAVDDWADEHGLQPDVCELVNVREHVPQDFEEVMSEKRVVKQPDSEITYTPLEQLGSYEICRVVKRSGRTSFGGWSTHHPEVYAILEDGREIFVSEPIYFGLLGEVRERAKQWEAARQATR